MSQSLAKKLSLNLSQRPRILWSGQDTFAHSSETPFQLGNVWTLHYYTYGAVINVNGVDHPFAPKSIGVCEPYSKIEYHSHAGGSHVHYAFNFQIPSVTVNANSEVRMITAEDLQAASYFLPSMRKSIDDYAEFPFSAEVELWSILLKLVQSSGQSAQMGAASMDQRRIDRACSFIEIRMSEQIYAERIANKLGISVTHLGRLFKRHLDCPVATYIRRRRAQRANELLVFSETPIREIAAMIGFQDLANFNRLIQSEYNLSPREVREQKKGMRVLQKES
ncbi:MAG: helix-turn-helix transcriptional regulator [Opitutaceae bacterium]